MAKIYQFPRLNVNNAREFLIETSQNSEIDNTTSLLIACKTKDGDILTAYYNCDFGTKMELLGHVQCDIIDQMILVNKGRY